MKKRKQVHQVAKALAPRSNAIKDSLMQPSHCVYGGISWRQKSSVGMCGHLTCCTFFYLCETKKKANNSNRIEPNLLLHHQHKHVQSNGCSYGWVVGRRWPLRTNATRLRAVDREAVRSTNKHTADDRPCICYYSRCNHPVKQP